MRRPRSMVGASAVLAILLIAGAASAGWWDGVAEAKPVDLATVIKSPYEYKGKEVSFTCIFHEVSSFYNPYYTRFIPSVYVNFAVWPSGAKLWDRKAFRESHPFCFLERDHKSLEMLLRLKRFTRLQITGYVQSTFKNTPWIEVRGIEVLDEAITQDSLREIVLGDRSAERGDWSDALLHYRAAARPELSDEVELGVAKKEGQALVMLGRKGEAKDVILEVLERMPQDQEALDLLAEITNRTETRIPRPEVVEHEGEAPAEALPVEAERPTEAPAAMHPSPDQSGWEQYTPTQIETPVYQPARGPSPVESLAPRARWTVSPEESLEPRAQPVPEVVEEPSPAREPAPKQPAPEKPAAEQPVEPEVLPPTEKEPEEQPEPVRKERPKKRMSGPM